MPIGVCYGRSSKTGFATAMMRDLDVLAPRAPLPKRALPDCVRVKLGLANAEDTDASSTLAPSACANAGAPKSKSIKNAGPAPVKKIMKF